MTLRKRASGTAIAQITWTHLQNNENNNNEKLLYSWSTEHVAHRLAVAGPWQKANLAAMKLD